MNKAFKIIYSVLFFAVCAAPLIAMPFAKPAEDIEKRELSKAPSLVKDGSLNTAFSEEAEAWYNDRLPFRSDLLTGANFIKSEVFSTPTANVITGRDGWLFYETSAADYMDTNALSDYQLESICTTLSLIEEKTKSKGGSFLFVPMPNKSSVYGEYMPSCYTKSDENNYTRLAVKLSERGVSFLNMKQVLTDNKELGIYHKRDTHWNYLGALIGYNAIMDSIGHPHKTYDSAEYNITNDWQGDLDKLLYPDGGFMDEQYRFDIVYDDFRFTMPANAVDTAKSLESFMSDREENDTRIRAQKKTASGSGSLYMLRDSFGRALLPFMIDNYDTSMFIRGTSPDMNMVAPGSDMIYEIVERNLANITLNAPFMTAPEREGLEYTGDYAADGNSIFCSEESYGIKLFGTLDENFVSPDARVYVHLSGENGTHIYEAFPIREDKLLSEKGENHAQYGFSLLVSLDDMPKGEYSASVIGNGMKSVELEKITIKGDI